MKAIVSVCLFGLVAVALARPNEEEDAYPTKYDGINYKEIVESARLLEGYFKCLMETGPCTAEGKELKAHLGDALETGCTKCSKKQQEGAEYVIRFLIHKKPEMWQALKAKYDPEEKYAHKYEEKYKEVQKE